ncbi:MBL fold metallo-hydrolase [Lachnospiraceae bacterium ZAX-1]
MALGKNKNSSKRKLHTDSVWDKSLKLGKKQEFLETKGHRDMIRQRKKFLSAVLRTLLFVLLLTIAGCANENERAQTLETKGMLDTGTEESVATAESTGQAETEPAGQTEAGLTETGLTGQAETESTGQTEAGSTGLTETEAGLTEAGSTSLAESTEAGEPLFVHFLDVGQGNAVLISQGETYMLIDGGDREYSSFVVSYLKKLGITQLDYVVVSHYDADHLNGVVGVLNVFSVKQVLGPDYETDTRVYQSFLKVIKEKEIPFSIPNLNDTYAFAQSTFCIVSPISYEYADENDKSVGIRLAYQDNSFLICGDAGDDSEQDMLLKKVDLESDVFMANHHGSKYSNSEAFLQAVNPQAVVVSCGMKNSYGHPAESVLQGIQKKNVDLYRTDLQGTIIAESDGNQIAFNITPSMDYRSGEELANGGQDNKAKEAIALLEEDFKVSSVQSDEVVPPLDQGGSNLSKQAGFVLNTSTKKFHFPSCSSVDDMKEKNKEYTDKSRDEIVKDGYDPCKRCNP